MRSLRTPLADLGSRSSDIEHAGGVLRVTVERADGTAIDIDAIAAATRAISACSSTTHDPIAGPLHARGLEPRARAPPAHPGPLRPGGRPAGRGQDHARASTASRRRHRSAHRRRRHGIVVTIRERRRSGRAHARLRRDRAGPHRLRVGCAAEGARTVAEGAEGHRAKAPRPPRSNSCEGGCTVSTATPT